MNRLETLQAMAILKIAYPNYYARADKVETENAVSLWAEMFAEDPFFLVAAAVKALIASDTKGFPPHIGAVKAKMRQISAPESMTELDAWRLVSKAIWGASMEPWSRRFTAKGGLDQRTSAQRNFENLPPSIRQLVGCPEQLAKWAEVSKDELETVVQSNFMRSYRERAAQIREYEALPADIQSMITSVSESMKLENSLHK